MFTTERRWVLGGLAAGAGLIGSIRRAWAAGEDGHAAGHDAVASANHVATIARKPGDPVTFTAALDKAPIKATSGGWAREMTARTLPIATDIAGAHLFLNPGGIREMHWHSSAEWAYVLDGRCQVTVVDPEGLVEIANFATGDVWYFPPGHAHSIQTIGTEPCHAVLAFNDGLYSEHGTFGLTDWISRLDPAALTQVTGVPATRLETFPKGETYIMQGPVLAADSEEAGAAEELPAAISHRYRLSDRPHTERAGSALYVASARDFPMSERMTSIMARLAPGAILAPHWHPNANEWQYLARGRARVTLFAPDKRLAIAELGPGDCAYLPRAAGHMVENIGTEPCELVGVLDNGAYVEARLCDWLGRAPAHALAANLGVPRAELPRFAKDRGAIAPPS